MAFKLTEKNAMGTLWKRGRTVYMLTGPITSAGYNILNMASGLLHFTLREWSFNEIQEELARYEYLGHVSELDIDSFIEEKKCLKKIS